MKMLTGSVDEGLGCQQALGTMACELGRNVLCGKSDTTQTYDRRYRDRGRREAALVLSVVRREDNVLTAGLIARKGSNVPSGMGYTDAGNRFWQRPRGRGVEGGNWKLTYPIGIAISNEIAADGERPDRMGTSNDPQRSLYRFSFHNSYGRNPQLHVLGFPQQKFVRLTANRKCGWQKPRMRGAAI